MIVRKLCLKVTSFYSSHLREDTKLDMTAQTSAIQNCNSRVTVLKALFKNDSLQYLNYKTNSNYLSLHFSNMYWL